MKKYLLRNRHALLAGAVAAFAILALLEAGLSERELLSIELDNSFLQLKVNDLEMLEGLDIDF